jgi:glucans biosynthesis protein
MMETRRSFLGRSLTQALSWAALAAAPATAWPRAGDGSIDFDSLAALAAERARAPFQPPAAVSAERRALEYDAVRQLRFRPEHALWRGDGSSLELQFFPLAGSGVQALQMFEIDAGRARPLTLPYDAFDHAGVLPAPRPGEVPPVAGWRATGPLNEPGKRDELIAFLGASYFRAIGAGQHYGLSARGLAVDTVGGVGPEEFPAFTSFWFERPAAGSMTFSFLALLDGPSVAGAYRFVVRAGESTVVDVQARLFVRRAGVRLGLAPLSSMFFFGENQPRADDFRPEVHDSDGLLVLTAGGEQLWRPLLNPGQPFVTSFDAPSLRGFGLMQRDREHARYEDLEARYDTRPSAWIEPLGAWGAGRVELLQFHTPDETHDNIAAYWVPERAPRPGTAFDAAWRIHWTRAALPASDIAIVTQTRRGQGWRRPGEPPRLDLHIDFEGPALRGLRADEVEAVVSHNDALSLRGVQAYPNPVRGGWRVTLQLERPGPRLAGELRAYLKSGTRTLSETWSYALPPE